MPATRRNEPISALTNGDKAVGFALLTKKELRQDKNGRDYLDLELTDASGSIGAKVWSDSPALTGDYDSYDFVAFSGTVSTFRDQLQFNVKECRRVTEADRAHGFDEARLIPSTHASIDELYERLEQIYRQEVELQVLRKLADEALAAHGPALREHPAAKTIHHAYRGGLLEHVVSMAELALRVCHHYPELDRDLVLLGVLFHDLGKIRELGAMPANDYTREGRLVGHLVIGRDLLRESCQTIDDFPADLQLELEHLVLSHQGQLEFGSPVEPMTAEALVLHFIDNLDAKLAQLRQARKRGSGFQFLRGFGRYIWVGEGSEPVEAAEDEDEPRQPRLDL